MSNMWMVRAGEGAFLIDQFKEKNIIAIGFNMGDLNNKNKNEIETLFDKVYPTITKSQRGILISQIFKFKYTFKKGDYVLSYNPTNRKYLVGNIKSDCYYDCEKLKSPLDDSPLDANYDNIRDVKWIGEVNRDDLKVSTKNTLGAISTIFNINENARADILNALKQPNKKIIDHDEEKTELITIKEDLKEKSIEFIKDKVNSLNWDDIQELVAGLLRSMGYKTIISAKGSDRGKDIVASPDGLGLEDPIILVEVKHRNSSTNSQQIRSFKGALKHGNKGLYVSTGGFTTDAKYEAERSEIQITLMDLDMLVKFIIQYYDKFDNEARSLIPLTKIYWPL